MGNAIFTADLTQKPVARHRILRLNSLAVISQGHSRPTYDAVIWLDSTLSPDDWATAVNGLSTHPAVVTVSPTWIMAVFFYHAINAICTKSNANDPISSSEGA